MSFRDNLVGVIEIFLGEPSTTRLPPFGRQDDKSGDVSTPSPLWGTPSKPEGELQLLRIKIILGGIPCTLW